jgi:TonB family protein
METTVYAIPTADEIAQMSRRIYALEQRQSERDLAVIRRRLKALEALVSPQPSKDIRNVKNILILLFCGFWAAFADGQGPNEGFVMESEGIRHQLSHPTPVYPPIAKAAHVQGDVLLHADVDEHGKVTAVEAIGGPPMLRQAAIEAVKRWTYQPFAVDGKIAPVHVVVSMPFSPGIPGATEKSDQAIGQAFFPLDTLCRADNSQHDYKKGIKDCSDLVTIALRFPNPAQRANEIRGAHESYGQSLAFSGDLQNALDQFEQAIAVAKKSLTPKDEEYATAYYWRAFAEHALKMPTLAEQDYNVAEASYRQAIVNLPDMTRIYSRELAHTLAYHSILARQTARDDLADKMQAEALQLDPHSMDGMGVQK